MEIDAMLSIRSKPIGFMIGAKKFMAVRGTMLQDFLRFVNVRCIFLTCFAQMAFATHEADIKSLAVEVREKGWICFPARTQNGDWDLFLMRPDGSQLQNITHTPDASESYPLFSRDGTRLLFRRLAVREAIDGNDYGRQGVPMVADSNGRNAKALGGDGDLPWASWSPDGKEFACLSLKGVTFVDSTSGKVSRTLHRSGFFQQLTWSPDGEWLSGVSNSFGAAWSVGRMDAKTGETNAVSTTDNCTPDWFPTSQRMIFSNRHASDVALGKMGWTQLWMADADGKNPQLVYAEDGRHIYGGHVSPDGKYVLFTGNPQEDGDPKNDGSPMSLMRLADAPIIGSDSALLRKIHPEAKFGPVLTLPKGWELCWISRSIRSACLLA
jgi:dipeptidyl aminopeptidase/acylaminoacyl peptidase